MKNERELTDDCENEDRRRTLFFISENSTAQRNKEEKR